MKIYLEHEGINIKVLLSKDQVDVVFVLDSLTVPDMRRDEGEEKYRKKQQSGCGPLGSFHSAPVSSTSPCGSGTKPVKNKTAY